MNTLFMNTRINKIIVLMLFTITCAHAADDSLNFSGYNYDLTAWFMSEISEVPEAPEVPEAVNTTTPISPVLTQERLQALLETRQDKRWTDGGTLLRREAGALGVDKGALSGAVLWIKNKHLKISSLDHEQIKEYHDSLSKEHRLQVNSGHLRAIGFTQATCEELAVRFGVTHKYLEAHRRFLLHESHLRTGFTLDPAAIRTNFMLSKPKGVGVDPESVMANFMLSKLFDVLK